MQSFQQSQRRFDVTPARVLQRDPTVFVIGFDRRLLFGQRPFEADVTVDVAVRQMVDDLTDRPVAVSDVELLLGKTGDGLAKVHWGILDDGDELGSPFGAEFFLRYKFAGRILGWLCRQFSC